MVLRDCVALESEIYASRYANVTDVSYVVNTCHTMNDLWIGIFCLAVIGVFIIVTANPWSKR